jgi:hypothetical protein
MRASDARGPDPRYTPSAAPPGATRGGVRPAAGLLDASPRGCYGSTGAFRSRVPRTLARVKLAGGLTDEVWSPTIGPPWGSPV